MEKLIELYYEHKLDLLKRDMRGNWATEEVIELADIEKVDEDELEKNLNKLSELKPFIKWLVDNDKIDFEWKLNTFRFNSLVDQTLDSYYALLMLLSIKDNPIEFLISILK